MSFKFWDILQALFCSANKSFLFPMSDTWDIIYFFLIIWHILNQEIFIEYHILFQEIIEMNTEILWTVIIWHFFFLCEVKVFSQNRQKKALLWRHSLKHKVLGINTSQYVCTCELTMSVIFENFNDFLIIWRFMPKLWEN